MSNPNISNQLSSIADQLKSVAQELEKTNQTTQSRGEVKEQLTPSVLIEDVSSTLTQEAKLILENAIQQISGTESHDLNPDQLYGWSDALQNVLGTKPPTPTSEVRQLQELAAQLSNILQNK